MGSVSQVQIITSGTGGWRYVDCVPINGGKLKALEYVRDVYRVPTERCVAAGDSCNDVLMLQGTAERKGVGGSPTVARPQKNAHFCALC